MSKSVPYSLVQLTLYFLKLGSIGFGGRDGFSECDQLPADRRR